MERRWKYCIVKYKQVTDEQKEDSNNYMWKLDFCTPLYLLDTIWCLPHHTGCLRFLYIAHQTAYKKKIVISIIMEVWNNWWIFKKIIKCEYINYKPHETSDGDGICGRQFLPKFQKRCIWFVHISKFPIN